MKPPASLALCLLVLGCGEQASDHAPEQRELVAPEAPAERWIAQRAPTTVSKDVRIASPLRDAGITPVPQLAADGGLIFPEPAPDAGQPAASGEDDDAGSAEPPACASSNCLCTQICERGLALECPADDPLELCVELCDVASSDCYEPLLGLLRCKVALPDAAYSCDPDFLAFTVEGCVVEATALQACRSF